MRTKVRARVALLLVIGLVPTSWVWACNVPVFRYALERWEPDAYSLLVFHRGPLSEADGASLDKLEGGEANAALCNINVRRVDLSRGTPDGLKELWAQQGDPKLPWMVLCYPPRAPGWEVAWAGPLTAESAAQIMDSPARRELLRRLQQGEAVVWLLVESGDAKRDTEVAKLLEAESERLAKSLELPEGIGEDGVTVLSSLPVRISFGTVRVPRKDKAEAAFIRLATGGKDVDGPAVIPVFGRGRALAVMSGDELKAEALEEAALFLCGPCSCMVKEQNPGFDLLLTANWDAVFAASFERAQGEPSARLPSLGVEPVAPSATSAAQPPTSAPAAEPVHVLLRSVLLAAAWMIGACAVVTGLLAWRWRRRRRETP